LEARLAAAFDQFLHDAVRRDGKFVEIDADRLRDRVHHRWWEAGERAFAVLRGAAEKLVAQMPAAGRPPALMVALHVWSLSHGIASLFSRGDAARRALPMPPEELLEAGFLIYLRGLGLPVR